VVFDNPHSAPSESWLWDAFVDRLLAGAPSTGTPVLETTISRTVIDTNRAISEIDPSIFQEPWPYPHRLTANVRKGMGLIPFLIKRPDGTLIQAFNEHAQLTVVEVKRRIEEYYLPYHNALNDLVNSAHQHHGISVHFNFHSVPRQDAPANKDIIIGDLYGKSAAKPLVAFVREFMKRENLSTGMNSPYPGGELIRATANPQQGRHSLQIEIARDIYMDQSSLTYDTVKGDQVRDMLTRFAAALQIFVKDQAETLKAPSPP
jgi:N-formylglutamate deformylase